MSGIPGDVPDPEGLPLDDVFGDHWNPADNPPVPVGAIILAILWLLPPLVYWLSDMLTRQRKRTVYVGQAADEETEEEKATDLSCCEGLVVMLASLEHSLPHQPKGRAVAGGLGKVVDLIARHHPTDIFMVHPMVGKSDKVDYGDPTCEDKPLRIMVDGEREHVRVFRYTWYPQKDGVRVDFLMLGHPMFEIRTKETIYPNPMSRRKVLGFFSLWNQAVGALLARHQPHIFHLPDFHTAVAPWYAIPKWPRLKILLVLHNAEYMGGIATDMVRGPKLQTMAEIWNLPVELVEKHLVCDGRLNMLKCAVDFVVENQDGIGVCAVSKYYATECYCNYSLLWTLPYIDGLDNPMLEEERATLTESLTETKRKAKAEIQESFGLNVDPEARIFVSLGRLVRQKGVDLIAEVSPWILDNFPKAQLALIGPIGDGFGHYAAKKLIALGENPTYKGRIFVKCEFMRVPEALKFAADFCLMPSRDEPFGYVDIEFAWRGALLVGAQAGGLGKVPGFYYVAQNKENLGRLYHELEAVVRQAMETSTEEIQKMQEEALLCDFPLLQWQRRLMILYKKCLESRDVGGGGGGDMELQTRSSVVGGSAAEPRGTVGMGTGMGAKLSVAGSKAGGRAMSVGMPATFNPYQAAGGQTAAAQAASVQAAKPFSMIDEGLGSEAITARPRASRFAPPGSAPIPVNQAEAVDYWDHPNEFITQELPEEEIAVRVQEKLAGDPTLSIDRILEMIGSEVDMEREASPIGKWLLNLSYGVANIHWCVALGYIALPIGDFLTFVVASEWGVRGGANFPAWFKEFEWFNTVMGKGSLNNEIFQILLFSVNCAGMLIGAPIWTALSIRVEPRLLMSSSLLLQVPFILMIIPLNPTISMALCLKFFHGIISSSGLLFIVFNFMMSIKGDMSEAAVRMGLLEMARFGVGWVLTAYILLASPSTIEGEDGRPMPWAVTGLLLPLALLHLACTLVPGVLMLYAPGPYRDDRLPAWDLAMFTKRKSFLLLGLSEIIGALASYPAITYVGWWMANGWTSGNLAFIAIICSLFLLIGTGIWAYMLSMASVHGFSFLIGTALLLAPPAILRALVMSEVSTFTSLGSSNWAMLVCVFSLLVEGVRSSALWTAKIKVLNSRWRLLSYGTVVVTILQFVGIFSPFVCEAIARIHSVTFITTNQKELADAVIHCVVPIGVAQFAAQALASFSIQSDMGVSTESDRDEQTTVKKLMKSSPVMVALGICSVLGIVAGVMQVNLAGKPLEYEPVHMCSVAQLPACAVVKDFYSPFKKVAEEGSGYGLNQYGQNTTAKFNCRQRMLESAGDSFIYQENLCRVLRCHNLAGVGEIVEDHYRLRTAENNFQHQEIDEAKSTKTEGQWSTIVYKIVEKKENRSVEVWSQLCDSHGKNLVVVHLMEWRWEDVTDECKNYLGPAGFNAVQVTPPQEHVLGDSWAIRYNPVSFKLESRSGNREEFTNMVKVCKEYGVNIIVDTVFNHMAAPFIQNPKRDRGKECNGEVDNETHSSLKCRGWTGTQYFNREFPFNRNDEDRFMREHFHHYTGNLKANCGLPPWTNNRHLCDLYGLPDLDTESYRVQRMLQVYLWDLYQIGVTMLRIDAALNIFPHSTARLLEPFPWEYIVQEYYPGMLYYEKGTLEKAKRIGSMTDFTYGQRVAEGLFPAAPTGWPDNFERTRDKWDWKPRDEAMAKLLDMGSARTSDCEWNICDSPIPSTHAMLFLDNHDQQRNRWKDEENGGLHPENAVCWWNGKDIGNCRPVFKHGNDYNLAMLYMLAYPYGEAVRVTSSYAWETYDEGPPGVEPESTYDIPTRASSGCKRSPFPTETPTSEQWDREAIKVPKTFRNNQYYNPGAPAWACEHRWDGVAGMVRYRRLVGKAKVNNGYSDDKGTICWGAGEIGFVALKKGWNAFTLTGSNESFDLAGRDVAMPDGKYCNLAGTTKKEHIAGLYQPTDAYKGDQGCTDKEKGEYVTVKDKKIVTGRVLSGRAVAIHVDYKAAGTVSSEVVMLI